MSNIFILIKCKSFFPEKIMCKISPFAIQYNFLWIGENSIKNYHIHQYRGLNKNIKLFTYEIDKILNKSKLKFSIISGNNDYLEKPSEQDFVISSITTNIPEKVKLKEETIKLNKDLIKIISKLKKTKHGYYLPVSIKSIIHGHPYKINHTIFISLQDNFVIKGDSKHSIHMTSQWLKRLSALFSQFT